MADRERRPGIRIAVQIPSFINVAKTMKTNAIKIVAVAMTAGALAAYGVPVRAADTRGERRAPKAKVWLLEEKLDQHGEKRNKRAASRSAASAAGRFL